MGNRKARIFVVAASLIVFLVIRPLIAGAEVKLDERHEIGAWTLVAWSSDSGYRSCRLSRANTEGLTVEIAAERPISGWSLSLESSDEQNWHLNPGDFYDISYAIDDDPPVRAKATAFNEKIVTIQLGNRHAVLDPLRRGGKLEIRAAQGKFAFSLAGSGRAMDALWECAQRRLGYVKQKKPSDPFTPAPVAGPEIPKRLTDGGPGKYDTYSIAGAGPWNVFAMDEFGSGDLAMCSFASPIGDGPSINLDLDRRFVWTLMLIARGWKLPEHPSPQVQYTIDGSASRAFKSRTGGTNFMRIELGQKPSFLQELRAGKHITFKIADEVADYDLDGIDLAVDAVQKCVVYYLTEEGTLPVDVPLLEPARPVTPAAVAAAAPISSLPAAPAEESSSLKAAVDRTMAAVKLLRMAVVIFAHDPTEEQALRDQLERAMVAVPEGNRTQAAASVTQAFLGHHVELAMKTAPSDVIVKLIEHDRDVMQQLRSQPEDCAAFFKANGSGDFSFLSNEQRLEQGEIYADIVEASMARPVTPEQPVGEEQAAGWMSQAYAAAGYPFQDLARLADVWTLQPGEVCKLGNEYMAAVATLKEDQAGALYRSMSMASP